MCTGSVGTKIPSDMVYRQRRSMLGSHGYALDQIRSLMRQVSIRKDSVAENKYRCGGDA